MTAILIINNMQYTFGTQTNQAISRLGTLHAQLTRIGDAVITASAGYEGQPGTQFEVDPSAPPQNMGMAPANLFGVIADPAKPGEQGQNYAYAVGRLFEEWKKFWELAEPYIEQLDNGATTL